MNLPAAVRGRRPARTPRDPPRSRDAPAAPRVRPAPRACVLTIEAPLSKIGGQIFNVGDESQNYTLAQLGEIVARANPGTIVEDVRSGDWGIGGNALTTSDVRALAAGAK